MCESHKVAVVEALETARRFIADNEWSSQSEREAAKPVIAKLDTALSTMSKAPQTPSHITAQQLAEIICPRSFVGPKNFGAQGENEFAKELGMANAFAKAETILALVHKAPQAGKDDDDPTCPHGIPLHQDCFRCDETEATPSSRAEPVAAWQWRYVGQDDSQWKMADGLPTDGRPIEQRPLYASPLSSRAEVVEAALQEAIDVFEGMNDDEINEELLPRLRRARART